MSAGSAENTAGLVSRNSAAGFELGIAVELFEQNQVYVIDLFTIRASSGVLWHRMHSSVSARLRSILERLMPSATHAFYGPDKTRCAVTTSEVPPDIGVVACVRAAHELIIGLMGRCEFSDLNISRAKWDKLSGIQQIRLPAEELAAIVALANLPNLSVPPHLRKSSAPPSPGAKETATTPDAEERAVSAEHGFEPVWDSQAEAVCMYLCAPRAIVASAEIEEILSLETLATKERAALEFDSLFCGIEHLSQCIEREERFLMNVAISYETLASPSGRNELAQILRGVLPAYRPYMIFTLTGIPLGVPGSRLSDFVMLLRPFGRVVATLAPGERNYAVYQSIGLSGIGLDFEGSRDEPRLRADILHAAVAARRFKLGAICYHVADPALVAFASAADVRLFHGAATGERLDAPKRMWHLPRDKVLPQAENAGEEDWF